MLVATLMAGTLCTLARAQTAGGFRWPVDGPVLRGFQKPTGPYGEGGHQGLDIGCEPGTAVRSSEGGVVAWVGEVPRGKFVSVSHQGGVRTTYLDLGTVHVSQGDTVGKGQVIGTLGGRRDDSSAEPHLHFSAYRNGTPVDPRILLDELSEESFIRLCPVEGSGGHLSDGAAPAGSSKGLFSRVVDGLGSVWNGIKSGLGAAWDGLCSAFRWVSGSVADLWNDHVYPSLSRVGRAVKDGLAWIWNNRWVQAVVAGIAAALVVALLTAAAVATFGISLAVGLAAAVAAAVASVGFATAYAAVNPESFSFLDCFLRSLSAGAVAAGLVASAGTLGSAFSAGWAQLGLWGSVKSAFWSGVFSASFEIGSSYMLTGSISWKEALIAFGAGALVGTVGKVLTKGISPSGRILGLFSAGATGYRARLLDMGHSMLVLVREGRLSFQAVFIAARNSTISLGTRAAYLCFSGTFGVASNAALCAISGRPITLSGSLAAFFAGAAVGAVSLSYGARGIQGMLEKVRYFQEGIGARLKGMASKVAGKALRKGADYGFEELFKRVFKEEVAD